LGPANCGKYSFRRNSCWLDLPRANGDTKDRKSEKIMRVSKESYCS
jgi:hypothetical protein